MKNNSEEKALLRKKAEELLDRNQKQNGQFSSEADTKKLLHELQVHQIELEMINEELRLAKDKAAADAVIYQELYEFAPSGYISLLPDGTVVQLNFSSARMLGMERPMLINRNFRFLIAEDCRAELNDFFVQIFQRNALASCELQLSLEGKPDTFVYLEGHAADKGEKCNVTMIDITQRRLAEDRLKATLDALE
ncbi:MAG: PAS domain-containing protein, partial [Ignavibacteriales bacterium]